MEAFFTASKAARKKPGHSGFHYRSSRFPHPHRGLSPVAASRPPSPLPQKNFFKTKKPPSFPESFFFSDYAIISSFLRSI